MNEVAIGRSRRSLAVSPNERTERYFDFGEGRERNRHNENLGSEVVNFGSLFDLIQHVVKT